MAEKITLTVPYQPNPAVASELSMTKLILDWEGQGIHITFKKDGVTKEVSQNGLPARANMIALNKANLSTKSLQKRAMELAQQIDPSLAGSITGVPD